MNKEEKQVNVQNRDNAANGEELIDTLIAISVVSKRLAKKLKEENMEKEDKPSEQNE